MFEQRIDISRATAVNGDGALMPLDAMLGRLQLLADAGSPPFSAENGREASAFAERYSTADTITRRRFDALLKETELAAATGLKLLAARANTPGVGAAAAARFLGNRLDLMIGKLEALIAPRAIA